MIMALVYLRPSRRIMSSESESFADLLPTFELFSKAPLQRPLHLPHKQSQMFFRNSFPFF